MVVKNIILDMLPEIWPMLLFVSVVAVSLRWAYLHNNGKKLVFYRELMALVFILYILCLYYILTYRDAGISGINFIPFREIFRYKIGSYKFMKNVVGNILLFLPFGFFSAYYVDTKKIGAPVIVALIVSLCAEAMQYYLGRVFDIDDVILNVVGGFLGYLLFVAFSAVRGKLPKFMKSDGFLNFLVITIVVLIILYSMGINILELF